MSTTPKTPDVWIKNIGEHRGAPRVFLDATQAARAGFSVGERFEVVVDGTRVVIQKSPDGSRKVSKRMKDAEELPVIDINSKDLLAAFKGMDSVRVVVATDCVYLLPLASETKQRERLSRLADKVVNNKPLSMGSLSHGGGILSHAIHTGLLKAGLEPRLEFVNELRSDLIEQACRVNDAWHEDEDGRRTAALVLPMQELAQDDWLMRRLPLLEVLEMGLPCSGASKAGKAKRGLTKMEDHPEVGHLVHSALTIIHKTQPALVLLENVVDYSHSASAQILRYQLRDMGYTVHEAILEGKDFGTLENRVRWCLVGVTRGVDFDFDAVRPTLHSVRQVADILDPDIGPDHEAWKPFEGLKAKLIRDKADGKGFKMQTVGPEDASIPTLRKGYNKAGSCDPLLRHPTNPDLLRQFTPAEHARAKDNPEHLVEGMGKVMAHELLGQGIAYTPFLVTGQYVGEQLIAAGQRAAERGLVAEPEGDNTTAQGVVATRRQRQTG